MFDHDPNHERQLLMSSEMASFFAGVAESYQGERVCLHSDNLPESAAGSGQPVLLTGLTFARRHRKDTLTIHTAQAGETSETTIVTEVVWVVRDHDQNLVAVEIIDDQDRTLVLESC